MTDDDTITATRGFSTPDDYDTEHDTPEIDRKRITKEAARIRRDHPLSPPEPADPTAPPEGGEQESDNASDGDEPAIDRRGDRNYTADEKAWVAVGA